MTRLRLMKLAVGPLVALVVATGALAYWQASGAGSTSGVNTTAAVLTISAQAPSQSLLPTGAATGDLSVTVANPNAFGVRVNQLALDATQGIAGFSANATGCALSFATQDNGGAGWTFAPGNTTVTLPSSVTMGTGAGNACQGLTFSVYLVAS